MRSLRERDKKSSIRMRILGLLVCSGLIMGLSTPSANAVTPSFGPFAPVTTTWGVGVIELTPPTSNSNGAWTFSVTDEKIAKVVGNVASILAVGTTSIRATQAASGDFDARTTTTILTVNGAVPTLGDFASLNLTLDTTSVALTPPNSTSAGSWSYASSNTRVASIAGNILTVVGLGTTTITATQAANWNWASASKSMTVTVTGGAPTVGPFLDQTLTLGSVSSITLVPPTSPSLGAWTFTSSDPTVASIVGTTLTPRKVGKATITATQAVFGSFASTSKSMTVTVQGPPPTLGTFADRTVSLQPFAENKVALTPPTSNSTGAWSYTSSDSSIAVIEGGNAILKGRGVVTITAVQAAAGDFGASAPVTSKLTVTGVIPTIGDWPNLSVKHSDGTFRITPPRSTAGGAWSFESMTPEIIKVEGEQVTPLMVGQGVIKATQEADWNWETATAQTAIQVTGIAATLGTPVTLEAGLGGEGTLITPPTSNSGGAWSYSSADPNLVRVEGDRAFGLARGVTTISATQAAFQGFEPSTGISLQIAVKPVPTLSTPAPVRYVFGERLTPLTPPSSNSSGSWSYTSSDESILTIVGNQPTARKVGVVEVAARQASTPEFVGATKTFEVRVIAGSPEKSWRDSRVTYSKDLITIKPPVSTSSGAWRYQVGTNSVAAIEDNKLRAKKAGRVMITAFQAADGNYQSTAVISTITIEPRVSAKLKGRTITVSIGGAKGKVTINGAAGKVGKNKVGPGQRTVRVTVSGDEIYKKTFTVR